MGADATAPGAEKGAGVEPKAKRYTVLVIDDNPWESQFTEMILKNIPEVAGYKLFPTGWEAFNYLDVCRISGSPPDFILVDLLLEDMNGFAWIEHFQAEYNRDFPACRIFMFTNSVLDQDREKALSYPVVKAFIHKPLTVAKFDALIRPLLP